MKILLVNHQDAKNVNTFSGTSFFMSRAIKESFEQVIDYDSFETFDLGEKVLRGNFKKILKPLGENLSKYLMESLVQVDVALCQGGNSVIPFYRHKTPIVFWHDSTWSSFLNKYNSKKKFAEFKSHFRNLYVWDKKVLERADLLIFSSQYVAEACIANYKISAAKVHVVPFGANLYHEPSKELLDESLMQRINARKLQLTFLGKDWKRKGLQLAYELTKKLIHAGMCCQLNIIGCVPDEKIIKAAPFIKLLGYLDKYNPGENASFESILASSHFLIHPASSEPFGIALCEANSFGVPVFSLNVEGPRTIISHGVNGYLYEKKEFVKSSFNTIKDIFDDRALYASVFHSSLKEYQARLNWNNNVKKVKDILLKEL